MKKIKIFIFLTLITLIGLNCFRFNKAVFAYDNITHDSITFLPWEDATTLPVEGNYYLTCDVNLPNTSPSYTTRYVNPDKTLNLDLYGHTITHYGAENIMLYHDVYYVNGGTLSIFDSVGTGVITGCSICCIYVSSGVFNLYGGKLTGNDFKTSFGNEYGAVSVESGATFNLYGGEITGNCGVVNGREIDLSRIYGTINFYGGHVGRVEIYTATSDPIYIHGGTSNPLIIDGITIGKDFHMVDGKVADGSQVTLSLYGYEENEVVTDGYEDAGYEEADELFVCGKYSDTSDVNLSLAINDDGEIVLLGHQHQLASFDYLAPTCESVGHEAYSQCEDCLKYFIGSTEVNYDDLVISAIGHSISLVEEKQATCTEKGCSTHYECEECHKLFSDALGTTELDHDDVYVAALGHTKGNVKYEWYDDPLDCCGFVDCEVCGSTYVFEHAQITNDGKKMTATFTSHLLTTQTKKLNGDGNCGMHWVLIIFTVLFIAFYICWYLFLNKKEMKFLPAKIAKNLLPLFGCGLTFIITMIFGIIGITNGCGVCVAFFIINLVLVGLGVAMYFFENIVIAFISKLFKKDQKEEIEE